MTHKESKIVPFSQALFFSVIADVEKYHEFLPWCTRSRILHRISPTKFDAELTVGFKHLLQESYVSRVTLITPSEVRVAMHSSPLLKTLSNYWLLQPINDSSCKVDFDVAFEFKNQIHTSAAKMFFHEVHVRMFGAFLQRAADIHSGKVVVKS